jgi:hypothetical protein
LARRKTPASLEWWRFSDYAILDGAIVPTPDARAIRYDPRLINERANAEGQRHGREDASGAPPQLELLRLGRELEPVVTQLVWASRSI